MRLEMCDTPLWQSVLIWSQIVFNMAIGLWNVRWAWKQRKAREIAHRMIGEKVIFVSRGNEPTHGYIVKQ